MTPLLPVPRRYEEHTADAHKRALPFPGPGIPIELQVADPRLERAVLRWRASLAEPRASARAEIGGEPLCGRPRISSSPADRRHGATRSSPIRIAVDPVAVENADGYRLTIRVDGIDLIGGSPAGCFHGLQTLIQLTHAHSPDLPGCTVIDHPDFSTRGLLHDVTRGKVPTVATLKRLVDRLVSLKANQLQLYIEHAFVFTFDPEICDDTEGLTPDEVRELDDYCRERFINLVPALATFGHMGYVLSMPKYRHLAEVEATKSWREMTWLQRARGLTLDGTNPEAQRLVEHMWSDVLDAFSSPIVNICGDEPWDLGKRRDSECSEDDAAGQAYVDQILRTHAFVTARSRRSQLWGDVIGKTLRDPKPLGGPDHPNLVGCLPRDVTVLHWGYDDRTDYDDTAAFVEARLPTFVCPGTSGWKRILNAMGTAERNIATFARAGRRHGATGLINTDWGDHGHFNLLACSWHGIALGTCLAWRADHPTGTDFDERFAKTVLGVDDAQGVRLLREASALADDCETWRLLWMPLDAVRGDPSLPMLEEAAASARAAQAFRRWCAKAIGDAPDDPQDLIELDTACRFAELFAEKVALAHRINDGAVSATGSTASRQETSDRCDLAARLRQAARVYAGCWRTRNKPSGLEDILRALECAATDLRDHAKPV